MVRVVTVVVVLVVIVVTGGSVGGWELELWSREVQSQSKLVVGVVAVVRVVVAGVVLP